MTKRKAFKKNPLEWMPFYVDKFLSGTRHMTSTELGAYMLLLCEQWKHGHIPGAKPVLQKLTGLRGEGLDVVLLKFEKSKTGKMMNATCNQIRQEQIQKYLAFSKAGVKGAENRWKKPPAEAVTGDRHIKIRGEYLAITPGGWLHKNKAEAVAEFMKPEKTITTAQVYELLNKDYIQYDFRDRNHVFNAFKACYKQLVKEKRKTAKGAGDAPAITYYTPPKHLG